MPRNKVPPRFTGDLSSWAGQIERFLSDQTDFSRDVDPEPILLPHKLTRASAATDGIMLYDPALDAPIYSEAGTWEQILSLKLGDDRYLFTERSPTGLIDGGEVNIGPGPNDVEVLAGLGAIIDSYTDPNAIPIHTVVRWPTLNEAITAAPAAAGSVVFLTIRNTGVLDPPFGDIPIFLGEINQHSTYPSPHIIRDEMFLGAVIFSDVWNDVSFPKVLNNSAESLYDVMNTVIGPLFIIDGGEVTEAALFTLDQAAGVLWQMNRNWQFDHKDPHREDIPQTTGIQWFYTNRDFSDVEALTGTVDPTRWDDAGTVGTVPGGANTATIQRLYEDLDGNLWVLWGQVTYDNAQEAASRINSPVEVPPLLATSFLLGYIITEKGLGDWDLDEAFFLSGNAAGTGAPSVPITDHGALTGLADDDHLQYHTDARGDVRYAPIVHTHIETDITDLDRTRWRGNFVFGNTYELNDMSLEGSWLGVANKQTTDHIEPQLTGMQDWFSAFIGTPVFATLTSATGVWITGNQFLVPRGIYASGYRFYIPEASGNFTYELWLVTGLQNPVPAVNQIFGPVTGTAIGYIEVPAGLALIPPGAEFALAVVARSLVQPNNFSATWSTKNTNGNPSSGEANFQNSGTEIRINDVDKDSVDQSTNLDSIEVGGTLQFGGSTWTITSKSDQGSHFRYGLTPTQGRPAEADYLLTFTWGSTAPIPYVRDADYYLGLGADVVGFSGEDTATLVYDNDFYGTDLYVSEATFSDDWDFMAVSGGSVGGGGGGDGATTFTELTDTPGSYAGAAGFLTLVNPGATGLEFTDPVGLHDAEYLKLTGGILSGSLIVEDAGVLVDRTGQLGNGSISILVDAGQSAKFLLSDDAGVLRDAFFKATTGELGIGSASWPAAQQMFGAWEAISGFKTSGGVLSVDRVGQASQASLDVAMDAGQIGVLRFMDDTLALRNVIQRDATNRINIGNANFAALRLTNDWTTATKLVSEDLTTTAPAAGNYMTRAMGDLRYAAPGDIITSHSALSNLTADDHLQYYNELRGDARYLLLDASNDPITGTLHLALGLSVTGAGIHNDRTGEANNGSIIVSVDAGFQAAYALTDDAGTIRNMFLKLTTGELAVGSASWPAEQHMLGDWKAVGDFNVAGALSADDQLILTRNSSATDPSILFNGISPFMGIYTTSTGLRLQDITNAGRFLYQFDWNANALGDGLLPESIMNRGMADQRYAQKKNLGYINVNSDGTVLYVGGPNVLGVTRASAGIYDLTFGTTMGTTAPITFASNQSFGSSNGFISVENIRNNSCTVRTTNGTGVNTDRRFTFEVYE